MTPIRHPTERQEEADDLTADAMARFDHLHEAAIAKEKVKTTEGTENAETPPSASKKPMSSPSI